VVQTTVTADSEGQFNGVVAPLPHGVYRFELHVASLANLEPVSDLFVVADDATEPDAL
jgi:hypothetical protein